MRAKSKTTPFRSIRNLGTRLSSPEGLPRKRGIYLLPSFFTSCSIFAGFYAITHSVNAQGGNDDFVKAAFAIVIAGLMDGLDGRVARMTNTMSRFGMEYDSLSDLVSFGLAPAMLLYCWGLRELDKFGWIACFLFFACGALRLARFNAHADTANKAHFIGLPIPAGAGVVTSTFLFLNHWWEGLKGDSYVLLLLTIVTALLMVSTVKYPSFKDIDFRKRQPFKFLTMLIMIFAALAWQPETVLFLVSIGFASYGLLTGLVRRTRVPQAESKAEV